MPSYYSVARSAARRAVQTPFVITIGGGAGVRDNLAGHVLNVARVSTVYGKTLHLLSDQGEIARLEQWPVAVVLHDVWRFEGFPHLVADLGFANRTILAAAMDGIVRPEAKIEELWSALQDWPIAPIGLPLPANFIDNGHVSFVDNCLPMIPEGTALNEGKRMGSAIDHRA